MCAEVGCLLAPHGTSAPSAAFSSACHSSALGRFQGEAWPSFKATTKEVLYRRRKGVEWGRDGTWAKRCPTAFQVWKEAVHDARFEWRWVSTAHVNPRERMRALHQQLENEDAQPESVSSGLVNSERVRPWSSGGVNSDLPTMPG